MLLDNKVQRRSVSNPLNPTHDEEGADFDETPGQSVPDTGLFASSYLSFYLNSFQTLPLCLLLLPH